MSVTTDRSDIRRGSSAPSADRREPVARSRANLWTGMAAVVALGASVAGLLVEGVYGAVPSTAAMLRAYDLVTVTVVVPALVFATRLAGRGRTIARLWACGLLAYLVYTYAYYLFGTGFNDLFLVHVTVLAASLVGLTLQLRDLDPQAFTEAVQARARARGAAVVLGLLAVALGGMWVYFAIHNAVTGMVPAGSMLVETDTVVHIGMALDLAVLVPLYGAAALALWRRHAWGYVLGTIAVTAGVLHQLSYIVAMPFQVAAEVPDAVWYDPGEPVVVILYLLAGLLLLGWPRPHASRSAGGAS